MRACVRACVRAYVCVCVCERERERERERGACGSEIKFERDIDFFFLNALLGE